MFIDKTGNTVSAGWKNYGTEYSEGILQVQDENGKWGYVDTNGEIVLEHNGIRHRNFMMVLQLLKKMDYMVI